MNTHIQPPYEVSSVIFLFSGMPLAENALYGVMMFVTFSYPSGGGSRYDVLKI